MIRSLALSLVQLQYRREASTLGDSFSVKVGRFGNALGPSYEDFAKASWAYRIYIGMIERGDENVATYDIE